MFKPLLFSLAALSLSAAQSATAEEYTILMEESAFYPEVTYLAPGDIVTFFNANEATGEAVAADASWTTGQLPTGGSYLLTVTSETALQFAFASDATKSAAMSFDPAPLSEADSDLNTAVDGTAPEVTN